MMQQYNNAKVNLNEHHNPVYEGYFKCPECGHVARATLMSNPRAVLFLAHNRYGMTSTVDAPGNCPRSRTPVVSQREDLPRLLENLFREAEETLQEITKP